MASSALLSGKIVAVTGASRGIGAAVARAFAMAGAHMALTAKTDDDLATLAQELKKNYATECVIQAGDVTDIASVQEFYKIIFEHFGKLDVLVANAGILGDGLLGMIPEQDIAHVLDVNVAGVLHHIQAASRLMRRKKYGSIMLMSSVVGRFGNKGQTLYAASKAALIGAMLSAAKELGPDGVRVNAIAPGIIDTDMTQNLDTDDRARLLGNVALGHSGTAQEVADVALFLASDMSRYVSGQIIGVDGGMVV